MQDGMYEQVLDNLRFALQKVRTERDEYEGRCRERLATYNSRIKLIEEAISASQEQPHQEARLGISEANLAKVEEYLAQHSGGVRQADLADALGVNSGTVSVALRRLSTLGKVRAGEKYHGSRMWYAVSPSAATAEESEAMTA
jgi:predicted transcriptional regulator